MSYNRLVLAGHNSSSLLSMLVRPQILNFIARTTVGSSNYTPVDYQSTRPVMSRAVQPQSRVQHQIQNMSSLERHPNYFTAKRQVSHPNSLSKQIQETHPNNSKLRLQHPIRNTRLEKQPINFSKQRQQIHPDTTSLEKHPNYFTRQRQESHPDTTTLVKHPDYFTKQTQGTRPYSSTKQRQESYPSYSTRQNHAVPYYGQGQHIWRPKSDG